jgi:hypothetical protein
MLTVAFKSKTPMFAPETAPIRSAFINLSCIRRYYEEERLESADRQPQITEFCTYLQAKENKLFQVTTDTEMPDPWRTIIAYRNYLESKINCNFVMLKITSIRNISNIIFLNNNAILVKEAVVRAA